MPEATHRLLGLTDAEAETIDRLLGRSPNHLELAMYAVMWSEHCSYKSSRRHLRRLPTEGEGVLVGPGENAGVVDVGDGIAAAIRIESHNHPSAIEPSQGAATGVGGILRDIFTMGARPIALLDSLRFGPIDDPQSRWIADGVVRGISGYGNAVGVPTVGGEVVFDSTYADNPLVNVACLGVMPVERLVLGRATGTGNLAVLLGATTGRDGIGGVSVLASAEFADDDGSKRPSVQVGDPFEEKRLIEACLALLDAGLVVGIQDLGGAGLACATSETASRGGVGMDVDVHAVPRREPGMAPFEVMTSESQERMLAIVSPDDCDEVLRICERWEVAATVIGRVTSTGRLRIRAGFDGEVLADVPAASLHQDAPLYDRPWEIAPVPRPANEATVPACPDPGADLLDLLGDLSWVWSQYDHQLFLNTIVGPGGDATVLRLKHPTTGSDTGRGLALTADGNHRWCRVDPRSGAAMTVAESVANLACVGARPLALVNCLNLGNPEHPQVMGQLTEVIDGMGGACRALGLPVVGGNVSLYNTSRGADIDPTPVICVLGMVDHLDGAIPGPTLTAGGRIVMLGQTDPSVVGSMWAGDASPLGPLPALDLADHTRVTNLVRDLVKDGAVDGIHDVSEGGLGLALAEMAVKAQVGFHVARIPDYLHLFSESPSRFVACIDPDLLTSVAARAEAAGVALTRLGLATGDRLVAKGLFDLGLEQATTAWRDRLPAALG